MPVDFSLPQSAQKADADDDDDLLTLKMENTIPSIRVTANNLTFQNKSNFTHATDQTAFS